MSDMYFRSNGAWKIAPLESQGLSVLSITLTSWTCWNTCKVLTKCNMKFRRSSDFKSASLISHDLSNVYINISSKILPFLSTSKVSTQSVMYFLRYCTWKKYTFYVMWLVTDIITSGQFSSATFSSISTCFNHTSNVWFETNFLKKCT